MESTLKWGGGGASRGSWRSSALDLLKDTPLPALPREPFLEAPALAPGTSAGPHTFAPDLAEQVSRDDPPAVRTAAPEATLALALIPI